MQESGLSLGILTKRLSKALILSLIQVFLLGMMMNWIWLIAFGSRLWAADRWVGGVAAKVMTIILIMLLLVVFPLLYLWQIKTLAILGTVQSVWKTYRQEISEHIIQKTSHLVREQKQHLGEAAGQYMHIATDWFGELPKLVRWLFQYLKNKLPLWKQIEEVIASIDISTIDSEGALTQQVQQRVQPLVDSSDITKGVNPFWIVWTVNVVVLVVVTICLYVM